MYFLSIRYILILSCSVVSYFKKRGEGGGKEKREKKEKGKSNRRRLLLVSYQARKTYYRASCPLCDFIYFEFCSRYLVKILYIFTYVSQCIVVHPVELIAVVRQECDANDLNIVDLTRVKV